MNILDNFFLFVLVRMMSQWWRKTRVITCRHYFLRLLIRTTTRCSHNTMYCEILWENNVLRRTRVKEISFCLAQRRIFTLSTFLRLSFYQKQNEKFSSFLFCTPRGTGRLPLQNNFIPWWKCLYKFNEIKEWANDHVSKGWHDLFYWSDSFVLLWRKW